jgi:hypothetical protein
MIDIKTSVRIGAEVRVSFVITPNGLKRFKVVANSPESRDRMLQKLNSCLPYLELIEAELYKDNTI